MNIIIGKKFSFKVVTSSAVLSLFLGTSVFSMDQSIPEIHLDSIRAKFKNTMGLELNLNEVRQAAQDWFYNKIPALQIKQNILNARVQIAEEQAAQIERIAQQEREIQEQIFRQALAAQQARDAEAARFRLEEVVRLGEIERLRLFEIARLAEEERERIAEEARVAEEARLRMIEEARVAEELRQRIAAEEARVAEEIRLRMIEEARVAEELRQRIVAEEARVAEITGAAEEIRLRKIAKFGEETWKRIEDEGRAANREWERELLEYNQDLFIRHLLWISIGRPKVFSKGSLIANEEWVWNYVENTRQPSAEQLLQIAEEKGVEFSKEKTTRIDECLKNIHDNSNKKVENKKIKTDNEFPLKEKNNKNSVLKESTFIKQFSEKNISKIRHNNLESFGGNNKYEFFGGDNNKENDGS